MIYTLYYHLNTDLEHFNFLQQKYIYSPIKNCNLDFKKLFFFLQKLAL